MCGRVKVLQPTRNPELDVCWLLRFLPSVARKADTEVLSVDLFYGICLLLRPLFSCGCGYAKCLREICIDDLSAAVHTLNQGHVGHCQGSCADFEPCVRILVG